MSDTQLPRWLQELVERRVNASLESPCEWPNGQFPHLAFRAREIVAEDDDGDDGQVSLLQVVIDEAERLHTIVDKLRITKDGVRVVPDGTTVLHYIHPKTGRVHRRGYNAVLGGYLSHRDANNKVVWIGVEDCYFAIEAAEAAREEADHG